MNRFLKDLSWFYADKFGFISGRGRKIVTFSKPDLDYGT
jgi:hypothetical protein